MQTLRNDFYVLYRKRRISVWMEESQCSSCKQKGQSLKNYRLISLLPIFGKKIWKNNLHQYFEYLTTNKLISANQSGFKSGDSCVNQLLSITHEIYHTLDNGLEVRGIFLDISKAFGKVWHEDLILKLNQSIAIRNFGKFISV